VQHKYISKRK